MRVPRERQADGVEGGAQLGGQGPAAGTAVAQAAGQRRVEPGLALMADLKDLLDIGLHQSLGGLVGEVERVLGLRADLLGRTPVTARPKARLAS